MLILLLAVLLQLFSPTGAFAIIDYVCSWYSAHLQKQQTAKLNAAEAFIVSEIMLINNKKITMSVRLINKKQLRSLM